MSLAIHIAYLYSSKKSEFDFWVLFFLDFVEQIFTVNLNIYDRPAWLYNPTRYFLLNVYNPTRYFFLTVPKSYSFAHAFSLPSLLLTPSLAGLIEDCGSARVPKKIRHGEKRRWRVLDRNPGKKTRGGLEGSYRGGGSGRWRICCREGGLQASCR